VKRLAVIGGGSWGTALALALAPRFESLSLWVHNAELASRMDSLRENHIYLPGFRIPERIRITANLAEAADGAEIVLGVMPSHHAREIYSALIGYLSDDCCIVSATKGLEQNSTLRMSEVIRDVFKIRSKLRVGILSGPTFAREIAEGQPAAVVVASEHQDLTRQIQEAFSGPVLRLYRNDDPIGVELGAAMKNVIAIASGVCAGLGLGANTSAALITRGLAEITRLALAAGGQARTLAGLAGLGDLVLTCSGELSRNRRVGVQLGKGRDLNAILAETPMVAEGVQTTEVGLKLGKKYDVELPITQQMHEVLATKKPPIFAIRELMDRSLKEE
jgi:glycerol-3-phosphate dehydrogenase (NAD(P)+)